MSAAHEQLDELVTELVELVPPIDPPFQHWLNPGDASYSYCWPCAREARWHEMGNVGQPPFEADWWQCDPIEENIRSGIDGGFDTLSGDSPEACEICRRTLRYTLNDYGVAEELAHYAEYPGFEVVDGEQSYAVYILCLNLTWTGADPAQVAAATQIVQDALDTARAAASREDH